MDPRVDRRDEAFALARLADEAGLDLVACQDHPYYRLDGARPGPLPDRPVPVWVGSYGRRMLTIIGRDADGWTPSNSYAPPDRIPEMQAAVDRAAEDAGRDPRSVRRNYNVMGVLDVDAVRRDGEQLTGPVDHWVDTLSRYVEDLGFDAFVFWPREGDTAAQARAFAEQVVPRLRDRFGDDLRRAAGG
ncbi:MAG TPA: LLM class flavin-dependent oxidoreductase [Nitriliruptorales bacterium]|nr:LLM class flavin-dependent oxidoreductase [Nitriliruptorales bacterium]